jgi:hypothetical protein
MARGHGMLWPLDEGAAYLSYYALWTRVRHTEDDERGPSVSVVQRPVCVCCVGVRRSIPSFSDLCALKPADGRL